MVLPLLAAIYVALFAYVVYATIITQPYWDMLSMIARYLQYLRDGNLWSYLWEPHVQHRHVWMRLLTAFDARVFSGIAYPFIVVAAACQLVTAWLIWRLARSALPGEQGRWVGYLAVMLVLTAVAAVDCGIPMNGIYPQALMFSVLALVLFDAANGVDRGALASWSRPFALVAAMAAAFGNAAALCLWPILAWLAWKSEARRRWLMTVVVVGVVFGAVYVNGLPRTAEGTGGGFDSAGVLRAVDYLLTYLGLPWTRSGALLLPGKILGAGFLLAGVGLLVKGTVRATLSRSDRIALCLIAFSLATAVLAALGRAGLEADLRVPVRYSVFMTQMHVGVLLLAWPRLTSLTAARSPRILYGTAVAIALVLVAQQVLIGRAAVATTDSMRETLRRFDAGEETPDMTTVVYVDLKAARRDLDAIHAEGLYK